MQLTPGLYEQVIDDQLRRLLEQLEGRLDATEATLDAGESHDVLARYLAKRVARALAALPAGDRLARQVALCNELLDRLPAPEAAARIAPEGAQLLALVPPPRVPSEHAAPARPDTPLAASCLFTGTRVDPSLVSQLRKELRSADRVDILCSFIKWSGLRVLEEELLALVARPGARLRVITTSYMGATDQRAVDFLHALPNTEVRVSYDAERTRLHAKAYLFHRDTGFGTAYVGSANLSHAALSDGLEWQVKISAYEAPHLWGKLCGTFETYWSDPQDFELYDPERLARALDAERREPGTTAWFDFDLQPYPYQQEILDRLRAERDLHGRHRNLVVAATGTGKTVVAAFDYRNRGVQENGMRPRLLFVAHRKEILEQSADCFRRILRDRNFGDLMVGEHVPARLDHLFLSIQSFNSKALWERIPPDHYDYIVADEFHHAAAEGYRRLLAHFRPRVLLGLTATPERMDGASILHHFEDHIAAEIRLPEAIRRKLLCPFQYFGVTDAVDYRRLRWQSGGYVASELEALYAGNDDRLAVILRALERRLLDVHKARAVGFCVSVRHAEYMAAEFQRRGLRAAVIHGKTRDEHRRAALDALREGDINYLFVVDLLNEGVDIPAIDTILLLRPTESLTVFLQQIGRGLRLWRNGSTGEEKECLTILDFIGQANQRYDFESRFRALTDASSRSVDREIQDGFPHAPAGCVIELEEKAREHVLENIRQWLNRSKSTLVSRIASFEADTGKPVTLAAFLHHYDLDLDDVYRRGSWSRLCAQAGVRTDFEEPKEETLSRGLRRLARINSERGIRGLLDVLTRPDALPRTPEEERLLVVLQFTLWGQTPPAPALDGCLARLRESPTLLAEALDLLSLRYNQLGAVPPPLELPYDMPLELHAHYSRDEVLAALGRWTLERQPGMREGVLYLPELRTDILFVTLNKTEKDYSPTTMYEDYALGPDLFHWQSQSTTAETSKTGQRYIHHREQGGTVLLFVRENAKVNGDTAPFDFLGPVEYLRHTGSRPMSVVWRLKTPMPARLQRTAERLAVL